MYYSLFVVNYIDIGSGVLTTLMFTRVIYVTV